MFDVGCIPDELRFPLRCFAAQKAVEILKAVAGRPPIEWTGGSGFFGRRVVPLPPSSGAVAVVFEYLGDRGAALGDGARVSLPIVRQLPDLTVADTMGITSGQQSRASGRTHRGGMKPVVGDPLVGDLCQRRGMDITAVTVGLRRPDIVDKYDENVRRILRQIARRRERIVN